MILIQDQVELEIPERPDGVKQPFEACRLEKGLHLMDR